MITWYQELAEVEKQSMIRGGQPNFEWVPGVQITDTIGEGYEGILTITNSPEEVTGIDNALENQIDNELGMIKEG